jgi:protein-disulfide isomerase
VDEDALGAAIFELGLTYPQVRDRDLALTQLLGVKGTPTVIVLDPDGQVVYREHHVPADWQALL